VNRIFQSVASVRASIARVQEGSAQLSSEEAALVSAAREKRRLEFTAGRSLAKRTLAELGEACTSIPAHRLRYPLWPDGYVGSISHSNTLAAVAVARETDVAALGIDVEVRGSVTDNLHRVLFTDAERAALTQSACVGHDTVLFSCKESVYKAVFPLFHESLEFTDVEIALQGTRFTASCATGKRSRRLVAAGEGFVSEAEGHVVTLFRIRVSPADEEQ
jgi:4'-phosphopantetheinyl transferase EntD